MKYKGKEIGYRPTLSMVKEFIKKKGYDIDANDFFKKYEERNWLTTKNKEPYCLEAIIGAYNGEQTSKSDYYELLKDPRWQKRRLEIMQRDNFTCQMCGNGLTSGVPLNVHHYVYHKGYLPWEYPDKDLITLCRDCHHKLHEEKPNKK